MKKQISSYQTKRDLADALKQAMREKPFSKVTVSEIIRLCGVNRKTFYYHFEDIYALLRWMFEEEAIAIVKHFDLLDHYEDAIRFVMEYVEENDYIINCAYDSIGRSEMMHFFYADFLGVVSSVIDAAEKRHETTIDPTFKKYAAAFYTEALSGMLINLVKKQGRSNREQDIRYLCNIIDLSLKSIERYEPQNPQLKI